jgi:hypothetical protein
LKKKNYLYLGKSYFLLLILPLVSLIYSVYQAQYHYDYWHTGYVAFGAESYLSDKTLFKEIFVPYGFMKIMLHALILKWFDNNIFLIFTFHCFIYSAGIYLLLLIVWKIINFNNAIYASAIIFLLHPFTTAPWHNYILFFLFNLFIYLRLVKNNYYSIIILPICIFFSETFFIASILIFLMDLFYENLFTKKKIITKIFIIKILLYITPLFFFFFYILSKELIIDWAGNAKFSQIMLEVFFETTLDKLLILRIKEFFLWPIMKFVEEPQWFFIFIIIMINGFYLISSLLKKKNNKLLYISFCSLILMYNLISSPNIYRFSTGSIIGIVTFLYFIKKIQDLFLKNVLYIIFILIALIGFEFNKTNNNPFYVYDYQKKENINNDYFRYFKYYKWSNDTWEYLKFIDKTSLNLKNNCGIKYANNLAEDNFASIILQKNLIFDQKFPFNLIQDRNYWSPFIQAIFFFLEPDYTNKLRNRIKDLNIIIIANIENYPYLKINNEQIDLSTNMTYIKLPKYEFGKDKIIIFPKLCKYLKS